MKKEIISKTQTPKDEKRILQTGREVKVHFDNLIGWRLLEIYVVNHATVSGMWM